MCTDLETSIIVVKVLILPGSSVPVSAVQVTVLSPFQRASSELLATSCHSFEHSQPEKE